MVLIYSIHIVGYNITCIFLRSTYCITPILTGWLLQRLHHLPLKWLTLWRSIIQKPLLDFRHISLFLLLQICSTLHWQVLAAAASASFTIDWSTYYLLWVIFCVATPVFHSWLRPFSVSVTEIDSAPLHTRAFGNSEACLCGCWNKVSNKDSHQVCSKCIELAIGGGCGWVVRTVVLWVMGVQFHQYAVTHQCPCTLNSFNVSYWCLNVI